MNYYNPEKHHRRSIRLKNYDYSSNGAYFITLVTKNRENFFGEIINGEMILSEIGKIAHNNCLEITNHFVNVILDEFIIMPNHVHCVIFLNDFEEKNPIVVNCDVNGFGVRFYELTKEETYEKEKNEYFSKLAPKKNTISSIIRAYKASVTSDSKKNNHAFFQWQRNYYEHIIRNEKALNNIRKYIKENPMIWFLDKENEKGQFEKYKFKSIKEINNFEIKNDT
ncbi:MAG: transposase [Cyanobacteriota bacterium]